MGLARKGKLWREKEYPAQKIQILRDEIILAVAMAAVPCATVLR
jgi:hypothetical protein